MSLPASCSFCHHSLPSSDPKSSRCLDCYVNTRAYPFPCGKTCFWCEDFITLAYVQHDTNDEETYIICAPCYRKDLKRKKDHQRWQREVRAGLRPWAQPTSLIFEVLSPNLPSPASPIGILHTVPAV